jgi:hypothetical protein
LLGETLNEEKETDQKLTNLSSEINTKAIEERSEEEREGAKANQARKMPKHVA